MDKLFRERKSFAPRIGRSEQSFKKMETSENVDSVDVETEVENLEAIWSAYMIVQRKILDACSDDEIYDDAIAHQLSFEDQYLALKGKFLKLQKRTMASQDEQEVNVPRQDGGDAMNNLVKQQTEFLRLVSANFAGTASAAFISGSNPVNVNVASPATDLRLPRMNLPVFTGDFLEWQTFHDLFMSSVDTNPTLHASQKLYFLKVHLAGEAAALVSHLNIAEANYIIAFDKLRQRYDKPREIANIHISRFMSQPVLTSTSPSGLRSLHDVSDEVIRALKALCREDRDIWLLHILYDKLDQRTKELWCQRAADMPEADITFERFLQFLDNQCTALQASQPIRRPHTAIPACKAPVKPSPKGIASFVTTNQARFECRICSRPGHQPYQCGKFLHASPFDRLSTISRQKLCQNCLRKHDGESCKSGSCRKCGLQHHTLLHNAFLPAGTQHPITSPNAATSSVPQALISSLNLTDHLDGTNVLLLTAIINVFDKFGRPHAARAVLDSASQISFIRSDFCDQLGIDKSPIDLEFQGISASHTRSNMGTSIVIASRCGDYRSEVPCAVLEQISADLPLRPVDTEDWHIPESVFLADPQFHQPSKINVLLGLQQFLELWQPGQIPLDTAGRLPVLQNTKLGWVVSGRYQEKPDPHAIVSTCLIASVDVPLSKQVQSFIEVEEYVYHEPDLSEEKKLCEAHFKHHIVRDDNGCFQVRLPFSENPTLLGESRDVAVKRLVKLKRKSLKKSKLKSQYHAYLPEYLEAGHMSLAETPAPKRAVYLPHHCVVKDTRSMTSINTAHLLCSKSKVAPAGNQRSTIPRLELQPAVLLARLITNMKATVDWQINKIRAFTKSQVALTWLRGGVSRRKTYVANRVAEVNTRLSATNWSHVRTEKNTHRNSPVYQLNVFLDEKGILRVGGRLQNSRERYDTKHQMLLPRNSILTSLVLHHQNATNFEVAAKQLKEVLTLINSEEHHTTVVDFLTSKGVSWYFMPPRSPHHGGLWEAGVKIVRQMLAKMSGNFTYTFDELIALLAQVAATLNACSLTAISHNPSDPQPLTPAHFIIGRPVTRPPKFKQSERKISSMSRWQFIQRMVQEFQTRWQSEYVCSTQSLTRWQKATFNVKIGDLVLLVADGNKARQWPPGRILKIHSGHDNLVRVLTFKTEHGTTQRDVRHIRVIPIDRDQYIPRTSRMEIPEGNLVGGL